MGGGGKQSKTQTKQSSSKDPSWGLSPSELYQRGFPLGLCVSVLGLPLQTWRLGTAEMYSPPGLEARRLTPRAEATLPLKALEDSSCFFQLLVAPGVLWLAATSLQSLPLSSRGLHCVSGSFLSLMKTLDIGFRAQLNSE